MKKTLVISALAFALVAIAPVAFAATATGTLTVNASVKASCTIGDATLTFGAYDPIVTNASSPLNATPTTMSVACTNGVNPGITIPSGVHVMNGGVPAGTLDYELFADSGYSIPFATTAPGTLMGAAPSKAPRNLDIYGQIPGGRDPSVGSYTGQIVVTVNF